VYDNAIISTRDYMSMYIDYIWYSTYFVTIIVIKQTITLYCIVFVYTLLGWDILWYGMVMSVVQFFVSAPEPQNGW